MPVPQRPPPQHDASAPVSMRSRFFSASKDGTVADAEDGDADMRTMLPALHARGAVRDRAPS